MASSSSVAVVDGSSRPYALVPGTSSSSSNNAESGTISISSTAHPEHAGVHDAMRYGPRSLAFDSKSSTAGGAAAVHPLQTRLENWDKTRDNLKLQLQRDVYGLGAPLRTMMERKIVGHNPHFPSRQAQVSNLHLDILNGNDEGIEPVDFLPNEVGSELIDIHAQMEKKHRI